MNKTILLFAFLFLVSVLSVSVSGATHNFSFNGTNGGSGLSRTGNSARGVTWVDQYDGGTVYVYVICRGRNPENLAITSSSAGSTRYALSTSRTVAAPTGTSFYGAESAHIISSLGYYKRLVI